MNTGAPVAVLVSTKEVNGGHDALESERRHYRRQIAELEQRARERTAALESANHELEAFIYSVSHDLRAPLRHLNGFSKALLEDYRGRLDEKGVSYLQYTYEASLKLGRLVEDLIDLSRVTRNELRRQEVDLSALAASALTDLRRQEPGRVVEASIAPNLVAQGDSGLLFIALGNLMSNAWKFTSAKSQPQIEVGAARKDGALTYFVRDNGAGFDEAHADRLFGVFQRLHSQEEFPGTGLGLAIVKRIFNRHGGQVWAEGHPGQGATFYFTLPE